MRCSDDIDILLQRSFDYYSRRKNFGNGRFVDKLIQKTLIKHANADTNSDDIDLIIANDIPTIEELNQNTIKNSANIED